MCGTHDGGNIDVVVSGLRLLVIGFAIRYEKVASWGGFRLEMYDQPSMHIRDNVCVV